MTLSRDESPAMISTDPALTPSRFARKRRHSSLAFPSTGGAVILSLIAPASSPVSSVLDARG
jgi:hypothetical protein